MILTGRLGNSWAASAPASSRRASRTATSRAAIGIAISSRLNRRRDCAMAIGFRNPARLTGSGHGGTADHDLWRDKYNNTSSYGRRDVSSAGPEAVPMGRAPPANSGGFNEFLTRRRLRQDPNVTP